MYLITSDESLNSIKAWSDPVTSPANYYRNGRLSCRMTESAELNGVGCCSDKVTSSEGKWYASERA